MRTIASNAYDVVAGLGSTLYDLPKRPITDLYGSPYREVDLVTFENPDANLKMYTAEDIAFCNTSEFTKTGQQFVKTGRYTDLHPTWDRAEYNAFWDEEEKRRKEGMSAYGKLIKNDDGSYELQKIHITGEHYGYLNYAEIKRTKDFEIKQGALYSPSGELITSTQGGTTKSFSLPSFWDGDYYYFKALELCRLIGRHLCVGKARRKGYSYKNGWVVANRADLYPRTTSVVAAYDSTSLYDDGTMVKVQNYLNFINKNTDWTKERLNDRLEHIQIGFQAKGLAEKLGFLSNIYTAILSKDPGAIRGKDADFAIIEEAGKCRNLAEAIAAALKAFTDGIYSTGTLVVFGTGGGDESYWADFEELFYEGFAQNFIMFQNMWDNNMSDTGCGFFHPCFINKPGLIDIHGNSDIKGSILENEREKDKVRHSPTKLTQHEMEEPDKPSQAFSRVTNSLMPSKEIDEQLMRVTRDPKLKGIGREGIFVKDDKGKIKFVQRGLEGNFSTDIIPNPVTEYPLKPKTDLTGCWILYEMPYVHPATREIPEGLYHAWNDPFGIEKEVKEFTLKDSLASTMIYEAVNPFTHTHGDRIVALYVGRTENTIEYDEQMFLGVEYFKAKLLYENDRGDVKTNAKILGYSQLLKQEPEFQYQKDLQGGGKGRKTGISIAANMNRKKNGAMWVADWLKQVRYIDDTGKKILNLNYIYDVGILRELLKYDGKRNTDRVSTLIVGMYDIREMIHKEQTVELPNALGQLQDDYFSNPFN